MRTRDGSLSAQDNDSIYELGVINLRIPSSNQLSMNYYMSYLHHNLQ